ncbi:hypothetical protein HJC23_006666 [Cyclotella cryptica]|uniref:Uncharacterized protein n=1 Tax=Cyclotella cryptica TaxID=29204 RepID=A0ABD3QWR9_9STRA
MTPDKEHLENDNKCKELAEHLAYIPQGSLFDSQRPPSPSDVTDFPYYDGSSVTLEADLHLIICTTTWLPNVHKTLDGSTTSPTRIEHAYWSSLSFLWRSSEVAEIAG